MALFGNTSSSTNLTQTNRQVTTGPDSNGITLGSINTKGGNASNNLKTTHTSAGAPATRVNKKGAKAPAAGTSTGGSGNVTINATSITADTQAVEYNAELAANAISAVTSLGSKALDLAGGATANLADITSQGIQAGQNYAALSTGGPIASEIASPTGGYYGASSITSNKTLIWLSAAGLLVGLLFLIKH